jgi:hypothetical protein
MNLIKLVEDLTLRGLLANHIFPFLRKRGPGLFINFISPFVKAPQIG